jgi:hypothetical protein
MHRAARRSFIDYASKFELTKPNDVVFPNETRFLVPLLPVQNGLVRSFANCAHLCVTITRMKQHRRSVHHITASDDSDFWEPVPVQTFFRGNVLRYFTNPALLASSSLSDGSNKLTSSGPPTTVSEEVATQHQCSLLISVPFPPRLLQPL